MNTHNRTATPLDAFARFGCQGEGQPFTVAGHHALALVRRAGADALSKLPEGHGWRLFVVRTHDDAGHDEHRAPLWRCTIGRPDAWPYPSGVQVHADDEAVHDEA